LADGIVLSIGVRGTFIDEKLSVSATNADPAAAPTLSSGFILLLFVSILLSSPDVDCNIVVGREEI